MPIVVKNGWLRLPDELPLDEAILALVKTAFAYRSRSVSLSVEITLNEVRRRLERKFDNFTPFTYWGAKTTSADFRLDLFITTTSEGASLIFIADYDAIHAENEAFNTLNNLLNGNEWIKSRGVSA